VRGAAIDHLQHRIEHADDGAERAVFAFGETTQAVEMAEELIGPVDKVNDHEALLRIRLRPLAFWRVHSRSQVLSASPENGSWRARGLLPLRLRGFAVPHW